MNAGRWSLAWAMMAGFGISSLSLADQEEAVPAVEASASAPAATTGDSAAPQAPAPAADEKKRKAPSKLTEKQEKLATVSVDWNAVKRFLVERPALGLLGKDAVALVESNAEVDGKGDISARFDGQTYLFSTIENKVKFEETPARFVPALSGYSVVAWKNSGKLVPGSITFRTTAAGRLFLFTSEDEKKAFEAGGETFADADLVLQGYSPVVLVEEESLRKGDKKFEVVYEGHRVRFASGIDRDVFASNPGRYYPTLGGLDVTLLAGGKGVVGQAKYSVVYKNRLYSFSSVETRDQFVAQAEALSDFDVARSGVDVVAAQSGSEQPGHYGISYVHRGLRYLFANDGSREAFQSEPEKFVGPPGTTPATPRAAEAAPSPSEKPSAKPSAPTPAAAPDADPNVAEPEIIK